MNERIWELASKSGFDVSADGKFGNYSQMYKVEKFAELIVKESLSVLKDMHLWQSVNNQNYSGAWHDAVDQSIDTIKKHFGVEE